MADASIPDETPLNTVLDNMRSAASGPSVKVSDIIKSIGENSFATVLLVVALIMVTPLSGIPGAPTAGALIILLIVGQWVARRDHLWLPDFIMRRTIEKQHFSKALDWLDKPAKFIDRHTRCRLTLLARRPLKAIPLLLIIAIVLTWPFLEILPFFTTVCAVAVALFAFGLMTKDGLFVLLGYVFLGALALGGLAFI